MTRTPEQIFELALRRLTQGESIEVIQAEFIDYPALTEELEMVNILKAIPIATPPAPTMRYKFAQKQSYWQLFVQSLSRTFTTYKLAAIPLAFAMILGSGYSIINAAEHSLPGEKLYGIKIAAEQAHLQLTFDENKQAQMHVHLAQKRIDEARLVMALSDPKQEVAALDALNKQTEITFQEISQLAADKAITQNDPSLLDNLVALNKEAKTVLETATQSPEAKAITETALTTTKETDKNLARLIAAVNEQTLLEQPNTVSITGLITGFAKSSVTVEKNVFNLNEATIVLNQDGDPITDFTSLSGQVAIIGSRDNNILIAKKIVVIDPNAVMPTVATAKPPASTTPTTEVTPTTPESATEVQQPAETTAGFIVEPTTQQYEQ